MIFLCPFLHCKALRTAMYKRHINSIIPLFHQIILYVGSNDLKQKEPQQVAALIVDLARQIENPSDASITVSELVFRRDKFNEAVTITNKHPLRVVPGRMDENLFSIEISLRRD